MHFTSLLLATGLVISANGAVLPALFGVKVASSDPFSFKPTGTAFPGAIGTDLPKPIGTDFPSGSGFGGFPGATGSNSGSFPFATGTRSLSLPTGVENYTKLANHVKSETGVITGHATRTGTFPTSFPSGTGGFGGGRAHSSGGFNGNGHAKSSGRGVATGHIGATRTRSSGSEATGKGHFVHSRNTLPAGRRGWFF